MNNKPGETMKTRLAATILFGLALSACATAPKNTTTTATAQTTKATPTQPATKTAKNMQSVAVSTSPEGASCIIKAGDTELGTVASTPGNAVIKRMNWKFGADVTCTKEGFVTKTGRLGNNPAENQIGGNIGAIFTAVKMIEGSLAAWNDSVHVSLKPAYFNTTASREAYLDSETALLNSKFTAASKKYLTCKRKKCARKMAELQTAYDTDLAKLQADIAAIPSK